MSKSDVYLIFSTLWLIVAISIPEDTLARLLAAIVFIVFLVMSIVAGWRQTYVYHVSYRINGVVAHCTVEPPKAMSTTGDFRSLWDGLALHNDVSKKDITITSITRLI